MTRAPFTSAAGTHSGRRWTRPDGRRTLQLVLATLWLLDGVLQLQTFFFTKSFGLQMVSGMSSGNPPAVAIPITWSGHLIGHHAVATDAVFAVVQIGLGLAIAWRPAVKVGLAASVVWSLGVWWIGEGLGGVANGTANPVNGAPGAVILYALLAVLLWPADRARRSDAAVAATRPSPAFIAARVVGEPAAKGVWLLLWGSLAFFSLYGANRSSRHLRDLFDGEAPGEPGWIVFIDRHSASMVDHRGLLVSIVLAVLLVVVAVGTFLTGRLANATILLGGVLALLFWVVGENFGGLLTNGATDLNSGPLLILLGAAYWRRPPRPGALHRALDRRLGLEAV